MRDGPLMCRASSGRKAVPLNGQNLVGNTRFRIHTGLALREETGKLPG
jgi:hypothetical protein